MLNNEIYDVAVIGAGPAGSIASYELAKRNHKVVLLEKESMPRYKACGGVVATHIDQILDFSVEPVVEKKISKISVTIDLQNQFTSDFKRPFVYMVMRDNFDNFLANKAKNAGAVLLEDCELIHITETNNVSELNTSKGVIYAKYIIGADGANSRVRKLINAPRFRRTSTAIEREIYAEKERIDKFAETIFLDFGRLKSGYAWVFPKNKNFSIGTGGTSIVSKELLPYYNDVVIKFENVIGKNAPFIERGHKLPIRVPNEKIVYENVVLTGDAAGLIEPLAGEGIYYAAQSGQIAAKVISESLSANKNMLMNYVTLIDQEIQTELQAAKLMLYVLDISPKFWVPRLLNEKNPFFNYFCRIFTGEKKYVDFPKKFGGLFEIVYNIIAKSLD